MYIKTNLLITDIYFYSTFVYTTLHVIYGEVLNKNTRCSYVLPESVADVLLAEDDLTDEHTGFNVFHKISERVCKQYALE